MDLFITTTPFFTKEHLALVKHVAEFAEREIEVRAGDDEQDVDEGLRSYIMLLFEADLLRFAVAVPGQSFDLRSFCLIREALSYSSSLADLAFTMQGLGTYAIIPARAPSHTRVPSLRHASPQCPHPRSTTRALDVVWRSQPHHRPSTTRE